MRTIPRPWRLFAGVLVLSISVIGFFEQERRAHVAVIQGLDQQVSAASRQVNALRDREKRLAEGREARAELESLLLDPEAGTYYRQLLDTVVAAGQRSNLQLERLNFSPSPPVGPAGVVTVSGTVLGTEAEILAFVATLEENQPIGQLIKLNWNAPIELASGPPGVKGQFSFEINLLGPLGAETTS